MENEVDDLMIGFCGALQIVGGVIHGTFNHESTKEDILIFLDRIAVLYESVEPFYRQILNDSELTHRDQIIQARVYKILESTIGEDSTK